MRNQSIVITYIVRPLLTHEAVRRREIPQILDDLSSTYSFHGDLRPANIIRAPANTESCSKHKCVHRWNVIDFAWVLAEDIDNKDELKRSELFRLQRMAYRSPYFYTGHPQGL